MKDELERTVENITKEINANDIEIKRMGKRLETLTRELTEANRELVKVVFAARDLFEEQGAQTENSIQQENKKHEALHERRGELLREITDLEEIQSKLIAKNYQLEEVKAKHLKELRKGKMRTHLEKDLKGVLTEATGCGWIEDEKKYGKNIFASDPFVDKSTADRFYASYKAHIDSEAQLARSPAGHYRIFTKKEKVLESMVDRSLMGGFALDIRSLFDEMKQEKPERKGPPVR